MLLIVIKYIIQKLNTIEKKENHIKIVTYSINETSWIL